VVQDDVLQFRMRCYCEILRLRMTAMMHVHLIIGDKKQTV